MGVSLLELQYGHDNIKVLRTGEGTMKVKILLLQVFNMKRKFGQVIEDKNNKKGFNQRVSTVHLGRHAR